MHEGRWSARLGLRGIPAACESGPLAHELELVRYVDAEGKRLAATRPKADGPVADGPVADGPVAGGPVREDAPDGDLVPGGTAPGTARATVPLVHFQHLSAADSVRLVRRAKEEGLPVTAEATPHHLLLTDERLAGFDQNLKVNPPLRSAADRDALVAALAEGTIDCVATDHAPHAPQEKEVPIEDALFGTTGLETAFAALYTGLVLTGGLPLGRLIEAMSAGPCRVLGLAEPRLALGAPADFCVVDLGETWKVSTAGFRGKGRNCAFLGQTLTGRVRLTVVDGARRFARARGEV